MKKIIVGILSFALLITAQNVFAGSVTWNQASNDCKGISIINATTSQGYQNPCWPLSTVSADGGEVINVRIYYHNTGTDTATNTRIMLIPNSSLSSSSTTKSFYGRITSDQGSVSFSQTVTANLSSSQSLSFLSAKWYTNNTSETLTSLLNGQSGNEVLTDNGLAIGSITSGWSSQGSVVVAFKISSNVAPQLCQDTSATNYNGALPCQYPQQLCRDTSATNYGGALPCHYTQPTICTISNFTANPTTITSGSSSSLSWNTSNCTSLSISQVGSVNPSGSQSIYPTQTTTYTLTARGSTGATQTRTVTVYVNQSQLCKDISATNYNGALPCRYPTQSNCSITNFSASDMSIEDGDATTLRWNTNDCENVKISNIGNVADDGSKTVYPNSDITYVLTAYDRDGSHQTESVKIYVDENNNNNNNNTDCSIDSFTPSNTYVNSGNPVTLRWNTSDCDDVSISNIGDVSLDGSRIVYPSNSINYVLTAYGSNGPMQTRSILVTVNSYVTPVVPVYNNCAVTTIATNVNQNSAQLNGIITSSVGANTYFEYGPTINLGYRTNSRYVNGNTNFTETISGLSPYTIYFFRMISDCQNGLSQGAIEIFRTSSKTTATIVPTKPIIIQGTTVSSSESPIVLRIENKYQTIGIGDIVDYAVYYKNISNSKLTNPMVQVFIPQGLTLINSSRGTYSESNRTLSAPIEDLIPNAEGVIYLQARVDTMDSNLAQIVTTAVLVYTNPNGAQENAMAYVLNNPRVINLLGASAFFGNIFGLGLIGWLLLIILILLLVLIARSLYNNSRRNVVTTTTQKTISQ